MCKYFLSYIEILNSDPGYISQVQFLNSKNQKFILKIVSMMLQNNGMICCWKSEQLLLFHVAKGNVRLVSFRNISLPSSANMMIYLVITLFSLALAECPHLNLMIWLSRIFKRMDGQSFSLILLTYGKFCAHL